MEKELTILGIFLFLSSLVSAETYSGCWGSGMMTGYGGYGFFGWIIPLLFIVALVLFIIWIIKQIQKK